jgi:putative ABC transport system substrate-binding protein
MNRRDSLIALGALGLASAAPRTFAQAKPPIVAVLWFESPASRPGWDQLLGGGLRSVGHKEGQTHTFEYRWANGDASRYPGLARELIALRPAVIVTPCGQAQRAIREASRTLPIVALCADQVNFLGEVATLARPGGHTTGILTLSPESVGKRLQLLKEIQPGLKRLAVLHDANVTIPAIWRELDRLQPVLGLTLQRFPVKSAKEIEAAFETMAREGAQAVFVFPDERMFAEHARIAGLARKSRLPTAFEFVAGAEAGFLFSYGAIPAEFLGKTIPGYVDRILKGEKAGNLPIVQPSRFELIVNLKTAREIGITIPQSVLARADRVIE